MDAMVNQLQGQVHIMMQQMEEVTAEIGRMRNELNQSTVDNGSARQRLDGIETEVRAWVAGKVKEPNFVDIKTL